MKAAVLKAFGTPLAIETVPDPILGTGEVIVDVVASRVLSYMNEVLSGERKYLLALPAVPGNSTPLPATIAQQATAGTVVAQQWTNVTG